jgi:hypothetical protein
VRDVKGKCCSDQRGREMLWGIFCDLEMEGSYVGNQEWEGKDFVIRYWKENSLEIKSRKEKIFVILCCKENIFEIRVRRKIFWIRSWRGKYF